MTDIESLILYMCTFTISVVFVWVYQKFKIFEKSFLKKALVICGIMLPIIILQGFRYEVGTDYRNYFVIFEDVKEGSLFYNAYLNEPLFLWINIILKAIFKSPLSYFVFDAILMNVLFFLVVDYYRDSVDMPIVYFAYYMICFSAFLNVERQAVAALLFWFSIRFIEKKQPIKFVLTILCATLIHNTAIILLAFYLLNILQNKMYRKLVVRILGIGFVFLIIYFEDVVDFGLRFITANSKYILYILREDSRNQMRGDSMFLYLAMLIVPIVLFYRYLNKKEANHYIILLCIGAQIVFYFLENYISYGSRLVFYMYIGLLIYIGRICKCMHLQSNRLIIKSYYIIALFIYYYRIYYLFGNGQVFPYQFWKF